MIERPAESKSYDDLLERVMEGEKVLLIEQAIEACPWLTTDHMGERRYNYCTWCDGWVTAALWCKRNGLPIKEPSEP